MFMLKKTSRWIAILSRGLTAALVSATFVSAYAVPPAARNSDDAEQRAYVLDMQKIKSFATANKAINKLIAADKALKDEHEKMLNEPEASLADLRARVRRHPRIFGLALKNGLSENDVVLIPFVLLSASIEIQMNDGKAASADVSPAQITFFKQHRTEIEALNLFEGKGGNK